MIGITHSGDFKKMRDRLDRLKRGDIYSDLNRYGKIGVDALVKATPVESGETREGWEYRISRTRTSITIEWHNTHVVDGQIIAVLIQYGHGTGTGGYVQGRDYINPAMRSVFDQIAADVWKKVIS